MIDRREMLYLGAAGGAFALARPLRAQESSAAEAVAEKLVRAMGGREAWTPLRGLTVRARHYETDVAQPYDNILHIALAEPRMRFEGRGGGMERIRAVVGDRGWRVSEVRPLGALDADVVRSDLDWWETHVYRNVWRLAMRDPALTPRLHSDGRLELWKPDGRRLMWYRLNLEGEPVAFGRHDSDQTATILGPLQPVEGGVRLPIFSASSDGTFRAVDQRATVYTSVPPVDFERP